MRKTYEMSFAMAYKYPREVEIAKTLLLTATGKILKRELRTKTACSIM